MKQKTKSLVKAKITTSAFFGLLFFVALAGGTAINAPGASAAADIAVASARIISSTEVLVTFGAHGGNITGVGATKWHIDVGDGGGTPLTPASAAITTAASPGQITLTFTGTPFSDTAKAYSAAEGLYADASGVTDADTDTNVVVVHGASTAIADGQAPTISSVVTGDTGVGLDKVTVTFSENVDASTTDGTGWTVTGTDAGGRTVSANTDPADAATTMVLTLSSAFASEDPDATVTYTSGGANLVDASAANNELATGASPNITDGIAPTVGIVVTDTSLIVGETSLVTFTFSEAVTGFTNADADLTIANGTLTNVSSADGNITFTATFTPTASVEDATNVIAVDKTGVTDAALNAGISATDSNNYAIDTLAPINQDTVFAASVSKFGGGGVTIVSSGNATNNVWFAPSGTTTFSAGATMTTAGGTATTILAPATEGSYKLFVIDAAGNYSAESTATLTVDNGTPTVTFSPTNGATSVAVDSTITLTFSEAMRLLNDSAISDPAILITLKKTNASGADVSKSATINAGKTVITVTPSANLNNGQVYYVAIGATVEDTADNAISASSATFTTVSAGSSVPSPVPISTTGQAAATPANGGNISKTNPDGTSAKVVLPAGALTANAVITINPVAKAEAVASMPAPSGKDVVGGYVYELTAVSGLNTTVNNFEKALTLTFAYTSEQAEGMNEEALKIYYWDDVSNKWTILADSVVDKTSKTVTATTNHFSYFTIFEGEAGGEIVDGDIIQCQSSSNPFAVYIVKVVGDTKYIRHIVSLEIFNYYGHLKWENLKQVDSLDSYSLSGWARVNTGPNGTPGPTDKVYEINGDQTKHWINMTAEDFLTHGGSDPAIYTVNKGEMDLYTTGVDVMSL